MPPVYSKGMTWLRSFSFTRLRNRLENVFDWFLILVKIGGLVLLFILVRYLFAELKHTGYSIQPFSVPKPLAEAGYEGSVVAQRILDEVNSLKAIASSVKDDSLSLSAESKPDIDLSVLGIGLSSKSVFYYLGQLLGKRERVLSGELIQLDNRIELTLRFSDAPTIQVTNEDSLAKPTQRIQTLFRDAAEEVLRWSDPYRLAVYLYRTQRYEEAIQVVRQMLKERPREAQWAYLAWGGVLLLQQQPALAMEKYQKATQVDPDFYLAWSNWGWQLFNQAQYPEAIAKFRESLRINPQAGEAWHGLALCYTRNDQPQEAEAAFQQAIKLNPDNLYWYANYAELLLMDKQDTTAAVRIYQEARNRAPETADGYLFQAGSLFFENRVDSAAGMLEKVLEYDPYHPAALERLSQLAMSRKEYAKSIAYSRESIAAANQNTSLESPYLLQAAYNRLAMGYYHIPQYDSAMVYVKKAIALDSTIAYPFTTLAEIYALQGNNEGFYRNVEKAIQLGFQYYPKTLQEEPYTRFAKDRRFLELIRQPD